MLVDLDPEHEDCLVLFEERFSRSIRSSAIEHVLIALYEAISAEPLDRVVVVLTWTSNLLMHLN